MVVLNNQVLFSYTGLSKIEDLRTDHWLAQILVENPFINPNMLMQAIAEAATKAFKKLPKYLSKEDKRHAFSAVGWSLIPGHGISPFFAAVSNALTAQQTWMREAQDEFTVKIGVLPAGGRYGYIASHGATLNQRELSSLSRKLRNCTRRKIGPEPVAKILKDQMLLSASKNWKVGKSLMLGCLPHPTLRSDLGAFLTDLAPSSPSTMRDAASFRYFAASGNASIQFSPICVNQGQVNDLTVQKLNESGTDVEITLTRISPRK